VLDAPVVYPVAHSASLVEQLLDGRAEGQASVFPRINRFAHARYDYRVYTAYCDESGHIDSERFVAIAGFVATDAQWAAFDAAWSAVLARHAVGALHTTDLMNRKRAFRDWDNAREVALIGDLMKVIHDAGNITAVGAVIAVDDFRALTPDEQSALKDPFYSLFQEVIGGRRWRRGSNLKP
jgi:hypothetical protein